MDIGALIDRVIAREGDYSDHPADRGGATRWGITEAVARDRGYDGAMRALPRSTAAAIYRTDYWQGPGYDRVAERAPALAAELFDSGVNLGTIVATGFLQRALNALNRGAGDWIPGSPFLGVLLATAALSVLAGAASYYVVERPFLRLKYARRRGRRT